MNWGSLIKAAGSSGGGSERDKDSASRVGFGGSIGEKLGETGGRRTTALDLQDLQDSNFTVSDERAKTSREKSSLSDTYRDLTSNRYEYKDPKMPGAAPGEHTGPMSDELRDLGVVEQGPDGYDRISDGRLTLANASMLGEVVRRLDELEDLR